MIFLSHNSKDKVIVEPFANKLAEVFGRDKVFYDSWSIQPGDGIIDRMESGLTEAKYFFFFVSENSLQSGMVKLEWQNAIMKATNGKVKFIPIRLDKSVMPTLLTQTLYLDVYQNGFDIVLRQMIDVINGVNTYRSTAETYENIKVKVKLNEKEAEILFYAETYMEPISRYGINKVSSYWLKKAAKAVKEGKAIRGTIISNLEDPEAFGGERVRLKDCIFTEVPVADWEAGKLGEESIPFNFSDFDVLDAI